MSKVIFEGKAHSRTSCYTRILFIFVALLLTQAAFAQIDTINAAVQGQQCASDRSGLGALTCGASDLVASAVTKLNSNFVQPCPIGTQANVSLLVTLKSKTTTRYNVGLFIGENGNDSHKPGGTCSVTTFPTTPNGGTANIAGGKWFNADGNACGDYQTSSTTNNEVDNVLVLCKADANGNLLLPYTITYGNNQNGTCTGPGNVKAGTKSKCNTSPGIAVTNIFVTTAATPACSETESYDPVTNVVTSTFNIFNGSNDPNSQQAADGTSFRDDLSAFGLSNVVVTCTNSTGSATCPTDLAVSPSNVVTGTIATFPYGGNVEITITANATPGDQNTYNNQIDLITPPTVLPGQPPYVRDQTTGISTFANACVSAVQLPVRLQKFDVK